MKFSDQISLSARNLSRRKGRTALTLIGVVIGTCMVVLMISLGIAQSASNDEMLQSWGDLTTIQVYGGGQIQGPDGKPLHLNDALVEQLRHLDHVVAATPYAQFYDLQGNITVGNNGRYRSDLSNLVGIDPAAMEPMGFALKSGSWLTGGPANASAKKLQVLVTEGTAFAFGDTRKSANSPKRLRRYGDTDAQGNPIKPFFDVNKDTMTLTVTDGNDNGKSQSWQLEVVGELTVDNSKGWWMQNGIVIGLQDAVMIQKAYRSLVKDATSSTDYQQVYIKVDDLKNVDAVEDALQGIGFTENDYYSMNQQRESMQQQVFRQQMIFGGIAAVSLLVAAINIINTMTMAIYERTREIGIMKVLGCELVSIRTMFLLESSFIGFLGGVLGVALSLGAGLLLNNLTAIMAYFGQNIDLSGLMGGGYYMGSGSGTISIIPPWLVVGALVFATLVGLVSGILPANKAVKISALEAIRHD